MTKLGIAIDKKRCIGCQTCALSCKMQNNVPEGVFWNRVITEGSDIIDGEKCIGCRMCMAACPYNARSFNWEDPKRSVDFNYGDKDVPVRPKGVAEKCTLCKERTDKDQEPMCVQNCPYDARTFGDLDDPNSEISKKVKEKNAYMLLEDRGTKPQVKYYN